jgi:hypothetical protein
MAEQKNPFGEGSSGAGAFKAAYDRLKAEAETRKQGIGQDYSSAYQQLRQQGYGMGLGASAQKGLSGGQAAGVRGAISAQQMGQLGNLMQGQERALRESKLGEQSIYSNALLEGQQAQEYENARLAQISNILTGLDGKPKDLNKLTDIERQQLAALGYTIPEPTPRFSVEQQQIRRQATSGLSTMPGAISVTPSQMNPAGEQVASGLNVRNWINPFTGRPFGQ